MQVFHRYWSRKQVTSETAQQIKPQSKYKFAPVQMLVMHFHGSNCYANE